MKNDYIVSIGGCSERKRDLDEARKQVVGSACFDTDIKWHEDHQRYWATQFGSDGYERHIGTIFKEEVR